jgi:hypothetical protein
MEKEFTDPSTYYYSGGEQFYSPQLSRSLSEVGETSSSQGACPSGNAIGARSGSSGFGISFPSSVGAEPETSSEGQTGGTAISVTGATALGATIGAVVGAAVGNPLAGAFIGAAVGAIAGDIVNFLFGDLFGGGSPPIPRQLRHQRHPLYPAIRGVPDGLIPDEASAAQNLSTDGGLGDGYPSMQDGVLEVGTFVVPKAKKHPEKPFHGYNQPYDPRKRTPFRLQPIPNYILPRPQPFNRGWRDFIYGSPPHDNCNAM